MKPRHLYDGIVPIGLNCCSAAQVQIRRLRAESGPVDWIGPTPGQEILPVLAPLSGWFESGFQCFMRPCSMIVYTLRQDVLGNIRFRDTLSSYLFAHEIQDPNATAEVLENAFEVHRRRGARLCQRLAKGGDWLFVLNNAQFTLNLRDVVDFRTGLCRLFPKAKISVFMVLFRAQKKGLEFHPEESLVISHVCRDLSDRLDMGAQDIAWSWLDTVGLKSDLLPGARIRRLAQEDRLNRMIDCRLALRIDVWKKISPAERKGIRRSLDENRARGQSRFRDLPWHWRLCMRLWISLRRDFFLMCIPSIPGVTAFEPSAEVEMN